MKSGISVVIPVHNGGEHLRACLQHLAQSTTGPLEVIVVDDASTDDSREIAGEFGFHLLEFQVRQGPARARNIGAWKARGEIILFLDCDVCVYPNTLALVDRCFSDDPAIDGIFGSYDESPAAPEFISQYKNLLHAYTHQISRRNACTFWSGCGAIRRAVLVEAGGFDESYTRACVEDIELGLRLFRANKQIKMVKELQVKHLKRWDLFRLLKSDILDRAIPWTELILRQAKMPNDLNLRTSQRLSVLLIATLIVVFTLATGRFGLRLLVPLLAVLCLCLGRYWAQAAALRQERRVAAALTAVVLSTAVMAYLQNELVLISLLLAEYILLFVRNRVFHDRRASRFLGTLAGISLIAGIGIAISQLPDHAFVKVFLALSMALLALNAPVYGFFASKLGKLFAVSAIPLHWLYYVYCGAGFVVGWVSHNMKRIASISVVSARCGVAPESNNTASQKNNPM